MLSRKEVCRRAVSDSPAVGRLEGGEGGGGEEAGLGTYLKDIRGKF